MLFGTQGQLDHPVEQLFRRHTGEIAHNEFLGVEPDQVSQFERLAARGEDEVPVPIVDKNEVSARVEPRSPGLAGGTFEAVAGQSLRGSRRLAERRR